MIRGLYTSASGMLAELSRNDVTSNNLANVNTTGYKKDTAVNSAFAQMLIQRVDDRKQTDISQRPVIGTLGTGAIVDEIVTIHEQGQLRESSNPFDMAIAGNGYFVVQNDNGTYYTRNGSFTVDGEGYLVTSQGDMVVGQAGPINLGDANDVVVDGSGNISANGENIGTLRLVTVANQQELTKVGDSLFTGGQVVDGIDGQVKQKFIESSNVNVITEMVNMITTMRAYEANQKIISGHDNTLSQAMQVGRLR
ncbi:flagellar basal-body rod protein FlgF [Phosphitispora sp. TUW77]|uniref:flagellar basal-body rod protein FlgF n=1 Tax=Phosphitispora sp. TUW77 TaxID=3152361 RepID=UPI003AB17D30